MSQLSRSRLGDRCEIAATSRWGCDTAANSRVAAVEVLTREEHLRDESILCRCHLEVEVRRPSQATLDIGTGLVGAKQVTPRRIRALDAIARKRFIQQRFDGCAGMLVLTVLIGLPDFDQCTCDWMAGQGENAARDLNRLISAFAGCPP